MKKCGRELSMILISNIPISIIDKSSGLIVSEMDLDQTSGAFITDKMVTSGGLKPWEV
ncbi:hypothetical protein K5X82_15440 [Halosquirtibacter xylanolyticus]|uniref:hypothetical protein n=1 Tax=Halosquirtibacter xylanolyticus TaxID=3374599 RepID=UPI003748029A|nr:hypothetical protein K5X82_15440 [Prolixibacteraceae bacterium]